jgi:probable HAF family extracellular repeat protein
VLTHRPRFTDSSSATSAETTSAANAVNDSGQVVGSSDTKKERNHAFLWSRGKMTNLGTLGGLGSEALGVNNSGQVVGSSWLRGGSNYDAFFWSKGKMTDLGTLAPHDELADSMAASVNDSVEADGFPSQYPP